MSTRRGDPTSKSQDPSVAAHAIERQGADVTLASAAPQSLPLDPKRRHELRAEVVNNEPTEPSAASLWTFLREDFQAHERDWTRPGFQAVAVHRFGVWRMGVKPKLLRAPLSVLYRAMFRSVRNFYGIELPYSVRLGRRVVFEHQHGIVIHGDSVIGDDCVIRQGVTLGVNDTKHLRDAPILGRGVDVGAGAVILGRIRIGDNASIGANAVVRKDVPEAALAVGVPARVIARKPTP